ncbi:MAG: hypothetical protein QM737_10120 [Ferruginibacter sp.]
MKQLTLVFTMLIIIVFYATAQPDVQTCIMAGTRIFTVSKTNDGKDQVLLSIDYWDEMMAGTKYCSYNLPASTESKFCIEIADKKYGLCKNGIGFGCSIFDCDTGPCTLPNRVNNENRICEVAVRKMKGSVKIIFIDNVDWLSLQNNIQDMNH